MTKFGYKVDIDEVLLSSYHGPDEFDEWGESYSNRFSKITKTKEYPDVVSDFDIKAGKKAYLVWLEYSIGDSFGWSDRGRTEVVGLFLRKKSAQELVEELEKTVYDEYDSRADGHSFYFKTSDGQEFKYGYLPWYGYFERLDEVHLEEVTIEG